MEETLPLLEEDDIEFAVVDDEKALQAQYKWKRKIPASKFGFIINAKEKLKDQDLRTKYFPLLVSQKLNNTMF